MKLTNRFGGAYILMTVFIDENNNIHELPDYASNEEHRLVGCYRNNDIVTLVLEKGKKREKTFNIVDIDISKKSLVNTGHVDYEEDTEYVMFPDKCVLLNITPQQIRVRQIINSSSVEESIVDLPDRIDAQLTMQKISEAEFISKIYDGNLYETGSITPYTIYRDGDNIIIEAKDKKKRQFSNISNLQ